MRDRVRIRVADLIGAPIKNHAKIDEMKHVEQDESRV